MIPKNLRFTKDHEWIKVEDGKAVVGITDFAQSQLGDVTFVETPKLNSAVKAGDILTSVESVKAASDIFAPVSGTIAEMNPALESNPELINSDPYGNGWICALTSINAADMDNLLSPEQYAEHIKG